MTPDMKRLCQAAERAYDDWKKGGYRTEPGEYTIEATPQAIVRAVLTELREVGDDCLHVGGLEATRHVYRALGSANQRREVAKDTLGVMLDHILAEPATAKGGENEHVAADL